MSRSLAQHPTLRFARALLRRDAPLYVHFALSSRCDLRCRACEIWRRSPPVPELSLPRIEALAGVLAGLGTVQVSLGGGEPALRPDLPDIVRAFARRGLRTRVLTNGVALTPARARRLLEVGLGEISFSLSSLDPALQQRLDGVAGAARRRLDNLLTLAAMLPRRGVLPTLNVVVSRENVGELHRLLHLARAIGFYASFIPVHLARQHGGAAGQGPHRFYGDDASLRPTAAEERALRRVYRGLLRRKLLGAPVLNSSAFLRGSPDYLLFGRSSWPCGAGTLWLSVAPDGRVSPCHAFEGRWGIPFEELPRLYRSADYRRRLSRELPACEGCYRPCWAEVGYLTSRPSALLEMARIQARGALLPRPRPHRPTLGRLGVLPAGGAR